ncbi:DUF1015 domain-containing protein [Crocinitomicaceae bacterium CZZ-1]|uniref:DUF1015 domain-containing protein n=1 Tax=Taishania pollutisoli TaxID=2766479 RepID=A0A8J6P821_9FLAO|nr:DUF1015 domain-containing protein [Taishania pollutisoli]MBC9811731.1 DUF1015 domain-containing protein [Taishania pollutisoli]
MAKITPFRAVRPVRDKVHLVATRPIYSYKKNVLESKLEDNPFTFLHIINPEFGGERTTQPNTPERFELVKREYQSFLKEGILFQEESPRIYIYRQTKNGHAFTGVVAGASNEEYRQDKIKKHEATLTSREEMFIDYLDIVGFNAEPVLLSYPHNPALEQKINEITSHRAEYEFTTTDRIKHDLWVLSEAETTEMQQLFESVDALYIADGHHRSASSVGLEDRRIRENRSQYPNESSFLAYMIDECALQILEFNRVIHSLNGLSEDAFIQAVSASFDVEKCAALQRPEQEHDLTICIKGNWYKLTCKPHIIDEDHPVNSLDAEILTQYILRPILHIHDLKTDKNIEFIGGTTPVEKIVEWMAEGKYELAVFLYPVTIEEVKKVADNQLIMPPKSTWVEPKLRSGMTIYAINE